MSSTGSLSTNFSYSVNEGNNPALSSRGWVEASGAVRKAQNLSRVPAARLAWSSQRNCPCSLISRNHHCPFISTENRWSQNKCLPFARTPIFHSPPPEAWQRYLLQRLPHWHLPASRELSRECVARKNKPVSP